MKTTIVNTVNQYKDDTSVNPALLWEMIKLKVREKSISYAAYKNVATKKREEMLEREIALLEKHLDNVNNSNSSYHIVAERIFSLKKELENIIEYRTKGAIIRSKSQWYNEGEKNSRYFLNLEKRHYKQGTISQLKINDTFLLPQIEISYPNVRLSIKTFIRQKILTASGQHHFLKLTPFL